jgi:hypothetical protein
MDVPQPVFMAGLGGAAVQLLYVIEGLKAPKDRRPDFDSPGYYLGILFNIALSVILGYVYYDEGAKLNKTIYFHIGLSAPLIMRTLATTLPGVIRSGDNKD